MKKRLPFFMISLILFICSIFSACVNSSSKSIVNMYINDFGELIVTYSDDTIENLGLVKEKDEQDDVNGKDFIACTHIYGDWDTQLPPTCTSIGYDTRICSLCGNLNYRFHEATGHNYVTYEEIINTPTLHLVNQKCTICGSTRIEELPIEIESYTNIYYGSNNVEDGKNPFQFMDIYIPSNLKPDQKLPVIITIHGGNWTYYYDDQGNLLSTSTETIFTGTRADYQYITEFVKNPWSNEVYPGCNCIHINIDYRPLYCNVTKKNGETIYTYQKNKKHYATNYVDMLEDIESVINFLKANATTYHIDPERIALMGYSSGGHLALLYAYTHPTQIDLVIAEASPTYFVDIDYNVLHVDESICALAGITYNGPDYIYAPNDVYNPNLNQDIEDATILREISPFCVANDFLNSQRDKPEEERQYLPYTVLAYGGYDMDNDGIIDPNSSDGLVSVSQSTQLLNLLTEKQSSSFAFMNAIHTSWGKQNNNKQLNIFPSSANPLVKEYYYGKKENDEVKVKGLQQLIQYYLFNTL